VNNKLEKIFHNINSGLSSTENGITLALTHLKSDQELVEKVLLLSQEKIQELVSNWRELKELIREK
jgi:hypothetical protein